MRTAAQVGTAIVSRHLERVTPRRLLFCALIGFAGSLALAALATRLAPVVALLAVVGMVVAAGMIASPPLALLTLCASVPFERIGRLTNDVDPIAVSVNRIFGVIALASLLVHVTLRKKQVRFGHIFALYAGYAGLALLSNSWAYSPDETFRDSFRILGNLLFFFLAWNLVRNYADAKRAVLVWLVASMAAAVFSLGNYYVTRGSPIAEKEMGLTRTRLSSVVSDGAEARSIGMNVNRLFGTTAHPTLFGLNNTMTIPFFLWAFRRQRGLASLLWLAGLGPAVWCIRLTQTPAA